MVNKTDNAIVTEALKRLYEQAVRRFPEEFRSVSFERFYLIAYYDYNLFGKKNDIKVAQIKQGKDSGKLTLEQLTEEGKWVPVSSIVPVDFLNLIKPKEDLRSAVARLYPNCCNQY